MTGDGARPNEPEHLVVGHISKAHGTKGELAIWPLTDRPDSIFVEGASLLLGNEQGELSDDAAAVTIDEVRPFKRGVLVRFDGVQDREGAESLVGAYLLAPIDALEPLEEGEVFYHQMLGMTVVTVAGEVVGSVREVYEIEPSHLLEVVGDDGRVRLIPFAAYVVKDVDVTGRRIVIDPPAGLLEI